VVHGARAWNDRLLRSGGQRSRSPRPKVDLEAWRRHHLQLFGLSRFISDLETYIFRIEVPIIGLLTVTHRCGCVAVDRNKLASTASLAPRPIAGCCHLANLMAWSQSYCRLRCKFHDDSRSLFRVMLLLEVGRYPLCRYRYDVDFVIQHIGDIDNLYCSALWPTHILLSPAK